MTRNFGLHSNSRDMAEIKDLAISINVFAYRNAVLLLLLSILIPWWQQHFSRKFFFFPIYFNMFLTNEKILLKSMIARGVLRKRCSENVQQIYRIKPMLKCDFNKVAKQLILKTQKKSDGNKKVKLQNSKSMFVVPFKYFYSKRLYPIFAKKPMLARWYI